MAGFLERTFGFSLTKSKSANTNIDKAESKSFAPPDTQDGATVVQAGGHFGVYLDLDGAYNDDTGLINRYRDMSLTPEIDTAITYILNDAIVSEDSGKTVSINLDDVKFPAGIKKKIDDEFTNILRLLNFNSMGHDLFRRWYVDGRLYYHVIADKDSPKNGITAVRYIDPRRIRKVREIHKGVDPATNIEVIRTVREYYIYNERGIIGATGNIGAKIDPDAIVYITSGLVDTRRNQVLGFLNKAIKPLNNLKMVEDATVIYRLSRAPERRVFYIDVGDMPTQQASQYLKLQMNNFRNKIVYDSSTGEVKDDRKHMSMIEDFWLPRRGGNKNTEIDTLQGGQNLGRIEDVEYMLSKLYKTLNVPYSRIANPTGGFNIGKATEIGRDEVDFAKFIQRIRKRFAGLFLELLKRQLILKGIVSVDDWDEISEGIWFDFIQDNNFEELRDAEILRERLATLGQIQPYVGQYYSMEWVRKNILHQSDEDCEEIQKQINMEKAAGMIVDPNAMGQPAEPMGPDPMGGLQPPTNLGPPQDQGDQDLARFSPTMVGGS